MKIYQFKLESMEENSMYALSDKEAKEYMDNWFEYNYPVNSKLEKLMLIETKKNPGEQTIYTYLFRVSETVEIEAEDLGLAENKLAEYIEWEYPLKAFINSEFIEIVKGADKYFTFRTECFLTKTVKATTLIEAQEKAEKEFRDELLFDCSFVQRLIEEKEERSEW